ncbi:MAG: cold shock domain-containing protein [Pseudomonadota bacterium]
MQPRPVTQSVVRSCRLKWFDPIRGYGFLTLGEGQPDVFLHAERLRAAGRSTLREGSDIVILVEDTGHGLRAAEVIAVKEPPEPAAVLAHPQIQPQIRSPAALFLPARVKWFERTRGYGFVRAFRVAEDVFIHNDVLRRCGIPVPAEGEALLVRVVRGERGAVAAEVRLWDDIEPLAPDAETGQGALGGATLPVTD